MPNWCNNSVVLRHSDPAMVERARKGFNDGGLFSELIPCPQELSDTVSGFPSEELRAAHDLQMQSNIAK